MSKNILIISDVDTPNMAFIKEGRKLTSYKLPTMIMLNTDSPEKGKQQGLSVGGEGWILKPFQPEQMLTTVTTMMLP